ncbi:hypothetical protein LV85_03261 [Algoriphagus chordae]|uniref:Uncharacterized protein n=1 Tax=Algoriphagus chordae TaxID=237019 RepID=A0A2W7QST4_9BACT|nr:hypothetical protein LV85_03261 [Algoriphagus chordae]
MNAVVLPVLLILWLAAIATFICFLSIEDVNNGKADSIFKTPIYGSLILFVAIIGTAIHYIKMYKTIAIDSKGIKISNFFYKKSLAWNEIDEIELIGKSQVANSPVDATILILKNGRKIDLIASRYENMPAIRKTLQQIIECIESNDQILLSPLKATSKVDTADAIHLSKMTKYSGNHILSFNGFLLYGWIIFSVFIVFTYPNSGGIIIGLVIMFGVLYGSLGLQLHYFYMDQNHLIIKNHVWPWVNDKYRIEDIKQVTIEAPYKKSTSLRVITNGFISKLYSGGSLKFSMWKKFLKDIQNFNIDAKNEAGF